MHVRPRQFRVPLLLVLAVATVALAACEPSSSNVNSNVAPKVTRPPSSATATWQYQLQGTIDESVPATVFDIDGFDTSAATVARLKSKGKYPICYISTSFENWRPDARSFPASVLGNNLDGWPGERWIDIRQIKALAPIFVARVDMCKAKGFQAVEFDNVDAHTQNTGFRLTAADQLMFSRGLAAVAHSRGLAAGLKNNAEQAAELQPYYDFAIVEECVTWNECGAYSSFTRAGKPVFVVEYERSASQTCRVTDPLGYAAIVKTYDLTSNPWTTC